MNDFFFYSGVVLWSIIVAALIVLGIIIGVALSIPDDKKMNKPNKG